MAVLLIDPNSIHKIFNAPDYYRYKMFIIGDAILLPRVACDLNIVTLLLLCINWFTNLVIPALLFVILLFLMPSESYMDYTEY